MDYLTEHAVDDDGLYGYELPFHTRVHSQGMNFSTANVSR